MPACDHSKVMIPPRRHKFPLVEVTWEDSTLLSGWQSDVSKEPMPCYSAGYLLHRDNRSLVLALTLSNNRSEHFFAHSMTIPTSAVRKVRRLK